MRISFDLDDTLIMSRPGKSEKQGLLYRIAGFESLRMGTVALIKKLKTEKHEIFVYTTSYQRSIYIRAVFAYYGIWLDGVVNQTKHNKRFKSSKQSHSKYPPAFGIDLHVDDSEGVAIEGERGGFAILRVSPDDD